MKTGNCQLKLGATLVTLASLAMPSLASAGAISSGTQPQLAPIKIEAECVNEGSQVEVLVNQFVNGSLQADVLTRDGQLTNVPVEKTPASWVGTPAETPIIYEDKATGLRLQIYLTALPIKVGEPNERSGHVTVKALGISEKLVCKLRF